MKNAYSVYKLTFPNKKIYIGITLQKLTTRWNNGNGYKKNERMYKAIKKYGWGNVKREEIAKLLTKQQAETLERNLIEKYNTTNQKYGYNRDPGGTGIGRVSPMKGKKDTEETKKKKSLAHKGEKCYWYGKKIPKEMIQKMKLAKNGKNIRKENPFARRVYQFDVNNNFIKEWDCIEDAAEKIKRSGSNITACCRGRQKTCGGYKWSYTHVLEWKRGL